jgi:integrase
VKPVLPALAEAIKRTPIGIRTFLVTGRGKPFSDAGIGNKMREWCDQAGLPECTAHGLKKVAATICANMGASDRMLMALFDWRSEKLANTYTATANRTKLAAEAAKLLGAFSWDENIEVSRQSEGVPKPS